jgi:hypothetical protein
MRFPKIWYGYISAETGYHLEEARVPRKPSDSVVVELTSDVLFYWLLGSGLEAGASVWPVASVCREANAVSRPPYLDQVRTEQSNGVEVEEHPGVVHDQQSAEM